jgi:hypothetical protein
VEGTDLGDDWIFGLETSSGIFMVETSGVETTDEKAAAFLCCTLRKVIMASSRFCRYARISLIRVVCSSAIGGNTACVSQSPAMCKATDVSLLSASYPRQFLNRTKVAEWTGLKKGDCLLSCSFRLETKVHAHV